MKKLKRVWLSEREYQNFDVVKEIPRIGEEYGFGIEEKVIEIVPLTIDCEQGHQEYWSYDYFMVKTKDSDDDKNYYWIAIEQPEEYYEEEEEDDE